MRVLSTKPSTLRITDNLSGAELEIYYRQPTTSERVKYANKSIVRRRNKIENNLPETRLEFGKQIMTGFRDGDFGREEEGKVIPLSSNPASEHYRADWKEQLEEYASDIIMTLALHVFEASAEANPEDDDSPEKN